MSEFYQPYTSQSLPRKKYLELVGASICVFNSNNSFVIENFLKIGSSDEHTWYKLIDMTSGRLAETVREKILSYTNEDVMQLFTELVEERNRIVHSFRITNKDNEQSLATKDKNGNQFEITPKFLLEFIRKNEVLSTQLYELRKDVQG